MDIHELEKIKIEINRWLCSEWPDVFGPSNGMNEMKDKFDKISKDVRLLQYSKESFDKKIQELKASMNKKQKKDEKSPIHVPLDLVDHLTKRIDQYLFKRWPDVFVDENFKEFKEDLYSKHTEVVQAKNLMVSRYEEWEKNLAKKYENNLSEVANLYENNLYEIASLKEDIANMKKKKWWNHW